MHYRGEDYMSRIPERKSGVERYHKTLRAAQRAFGNLELLHKPDAPAHCVDAKGRLTVATHPEGEIFELVNNEWIKIFDVLKLAKTPYIKVVSNLYSDCYWIQESRPWVLAKTKA